MSLTSWQLDYFIGAGAAAYQIQRLLLQRRDLELRLWQGRFELCYRGGPDSAAVSIGTFGVELTSDDWQQVVDKIAAMPLGAVSHARA